jgi:hypothetical protein
MPKKKKFPLRNKFNISNPGAKDETVEQHLQETSKIDPEFLDLISRLTNAHYKKDFYAYIRTYSS